MPILPVRLSAHAWARGVSRNTSSNCFCVDSFIKSGIGYQLSGIGYWVSGTGTLTLSFRCAFDRYIQGKRTTPCAGFSVAQVRKLHDCLTDTVLLRHVSNRKPGKVEQDLRASIL